MTAYIGAFSAIAAVALALAALLPFVRGAARKSALDLLEHERDIERDARLALEQRCKEEIAELRGQVQRLTHEFARVVALEVVAAMRESGAIK